MLRLLMCAIVLYLAVVVHDVQANGRRDVTGADAVPLFEALLHIHSTSDEKRKAKEVKETGYLLESIQEHLCNPKQEETPKGHWLLELVWKATSWVSQIVLKSPAVDCMSCKVFVEESKNAETVTKFHKEFMEKCAKIGGNNGPKGYPCLDYMSTEMAELSALPEFYSYFHCAVHMARTADGQVLLFSPELQKASIAKIAERHFGDEDPEQYEKDSYLKYPAEKKMWIKKQKLKEVNDGMTATSNLSPEWWTNKNECEALVTTIYHFYDDDEGLSMGEPTSLKGISRGNATEDHKYGSDKNGAEATGMLHALASKLSDKDIGQSMDDLFNGLMKIHKIVCGRKQPPAICEESEQPAGKVAFDTEVKARDNAEQKIIANNPHFHAIHHWIIDLLWTKKGRLYVDHKAIHDEIKAKEEKENTGGKIPDETDIGSDLVGKLHGCPQEENWFHDPEYAGLAIQTVQTLAKFLNAHPECEKFVTYTAYA